MRVEAVSDDQELLRLYEAVRLSGLGLRCAPTAPPQPPRLELLRLADKDNMTVLAAYDEDDNPVAYTILGDDGAVHWLCLAELNLEAIAALVKRGLADSPGRKFGTVANPELRAVFEQLGCKVTDEFVEGVRD